MSRVCAEQHHKFHSLHQPNSKKSLIRDLDIPPRKLLFRSQNLVPSDDFSSSSDYFFADMPKNYSPEETLLQKYLPFNNLADDSDSDDPYSSDHFRMLEFKVRRCTRSRSHDWTDCPFAHPGEKARRRDPRRYHYSGTVCPEYRRASGCSRGDNCQFAHGVFECWLHPARYRTEACKDGKNCKRKVCFFAHTPKQLRILPSLQSEDAAVDSVVIGGVNSPPPLEKRFKSHCCLFCHGHASSPKSTLMGISHLSPPMSPSLSPPLSPLESGGFSPYSRGLGKYNQHNHGVLCYKDVVKELMSSFDAMNLNEASPPPSLSPLSSSKYHNNNLSCVDVNFNNEDHQQFTLSPASNESSSNSSEYFCGDYYKSNSNYKSFAAEENECPDLGWVNDLLM
ncbi:Zinc finger, CCCH-type [Dillenia turbinata]|uniref:Zinc finger, CCCH-type n=1 Tax=Dillenia turbinata TaxID=194707 RepID=A0AAN8YXT0_9MAGN